MLGTRGIPANYGGFETCVEELAPRFAALGHDVSVYCRSPQIGVPYDVYRGVRLVKLPTIRQKYLDTIVHTTVSAIHAITRRYDVIFMFGVGNSPVCALLRLGRLPVLLNVDGLDWQRDKWPGWAKLLLKLAERVSVRVANRTITDSRNVQDYYRANRGVELCYIPYGATPGPAELNGTLDEHGLDPGRYFLYVGRLEPENRVTDLVDASIAAGLDMPTVIVGDAPYADSYKQILRGRANGNVRFTGAIYGSGYWELNHFAYAYIFPVLAGGTHPALIEAMACGNCVLARDTPDNRSVGGDTVRYFSTIDELAALMQWAHASPDDVRHLGTLAAQRSTELYNWDRVAGEYLALAADVLAERGRQTKPVLSEEPDRASND
ncbi:glycosyltransferase [soil metagenome]|jgi:glycosyltransferase involved in cell wall biosynthesis